MIKIVKKEKKKQIPGKKLEVRKANKREEKKKGEKEEKGGNTSLKMYKMSRKVIMYVRTQYKPYGAGSRVRTSRIDFQRTKDRPLYTHSNHLKAMYHVII